jgi:hypothetical protein
MDKSRRDVLLIIVTAVAVVLVLYVLWKRMGPPEPTLGPGQTLQNPFGDQSPQARHPKRKDAP